MSAHFKAVNWNRQKFIYDGVVLTGTVLFLALFAATSLLLQPTITVETILIRGLGITALVLLHVILCIGPLCRLDPRFLPLLYNRRHLGVLMCVLALGHATFAIIQFHALGDQPPLVSLLTGTGDVRQLSRFPYELLGLAALIILWTMAATSHDFWLALLSAATWKALHMLVYVAYVLLLGHVALGAMQADASPILAIGLGLGALLVFGLQVAAGLRERPGDVPHSSDTAGWVDVGSASDLPEGRARTASLGVERVAVVRHAGGISCVSNVCRHQGGPLGEGRVVDGCLTCPWHGYQYIPESGMSPPPFTEKIATYRVRIEAGRILVHETPNAPGTPVQPALLPPLVDRGAEERGTSEAEAFYIGYVGRSRRTVARFVRPRLVLMLPLLAGIAVAAAAAGGPLGAGTFEYGVTRTFEGRIVEAPFPALAVRGAGNADPGWSYSLLVGRGKHGPGPDVAGLDGQTVRLIGTLIHRDASTMIEIAARPQRMAEGAEAPDSAVDLGPITLTGEVVDGKCHLGVMVPGEGPTHRACAVRCISGGLPAIFVAHDAGGQSFRFLLVDSKGQPVGRRVFDVVAQPLRISGRAFRRGNLLYLAADTSTYERLP